MIAGWASQLPRCLTHCLAEVDANAKGAMQQAGAPWDCIQQAAGHGSYELQQRSTEGYCIHLTEGLAPAYLGVAGQQAAHVCLQPLKQRCVADQAVLDDLCTSREGGRGKVGGDMLATS